MSAIEQLPAPSSYERRRGERKRLDRILHVSVGRHAGVFIDASVRGAKIHHEGALRRGSTVRVTFEWAAQRFSAQGEVMASRIVALGAREGESATYESRFHFLYMSRESSDLLVRMLAAIGNEELRSWVGNLQGSPDGPQAADPVAARCSGYIRCRLFGREWEKKWTRDHTQPENGFLLPAGTAQADVEALCQAWEAMDVDARHVVRLTAAAIVEQTPER